MGNTPNVRFKGFTEDWEQRKFGDDNDLLTGYPFESEKFSEEGVKLVRGMNVKRGYLDFSNDICMRWKSTDGLENYLLEADDILIQMDGALIGKSYAKIAEEQLPALLVQRVTRARTRSKEACTDFMYQTIQRDFLRYIGMNKTETAVPHLSLNDIYNFKIMVPRLEEQQKIGAYFRNLDHLITLHQQKCDETKEFKKYMLQNMFPQKDEKVPKIRFAGFTGDWEQRKFDDLADYKKGPFGSALKKDMFVPKSDMTVKVYEQQNAINKDWHLERYFITEEYANKLSGFRVEGGDIIVSCAGTIGETYEIPLDAEPGIINQALMRIKVKESIVNKKMFNILFTNMIDDFTRVHSNGSAIKNIPPFSDLKPMVVFVPKMDEQNKISSYFSNLDHLITLHQQKCAALKEFKKYMLQNMFPQKGENKCQN